MERAKIIHPGRVENPFGDEKTSHRPGFDGPERVGIPAPVRQFGDVRVAEDFELGIRPPFAQRGQGRQRANKIANGPAANDQESRCFHNRKLPDS